MERRGWIMALGALLLIGAGLYVWWSDSTRAAGPPEPGRIVRGPGDEGAGGPGSAPGAEPGGPGAASSGRRRAFDDGGVPHVGLHPAPSASPSSPTADNGVRPSRGIPREDPGANESAGWRLGQARRRIAILEESAARYQAALDRFVADGNTETAERQRAVLERVQRRIEEFRTQEQELLGEAASEGTMGDVDRGYEEGDEGPRQQPVQGGTTATR